MARKRQREPTTERFIHSIQVECLDHFLIFGTKHFDHLVSEWLEHYHEERPHQAKGNEVLKITGHQPDPSSGAVQCRERLGGLVKHYYRKAG